MTEDCIFCKILAGKIPSHKIYENSDFFVFLDINPVKPGHTLVIPKKHTDYLFDLPDKEYSSLLLESKKMGKILKKAITCKRIGLCVEGFGVPHVHVHLIPLDKGYEMNPNNAKPMDQQELEKILEKIKKVI